MATTNHTKHYPVRKLVSLAVIIIAIAATLTVGHLTSDKNLTPGLAIDLAGGRQFILEPRSTTGQAVTESDINQAIAIIRQRVDASGVAEAEITSQGGSKIVVALPGEPSDETRDLVTKAALMRFRPVLAIADPNPFSLEDLEGLTDESEGLDVDSIEGIEDPNDLTMDDLEGFEDEDAVEGDGDAGDENTTDEGADDGAADDQVTDDTADNAAGVSSNAAIRPASFTTSQTQNLAEDEATDNGGDVTGDGGDVTDDTTGDAPADDETDAQNPLDNFVNDGTDSDDPASDPDGNSSLNQVTAEIEEEFAALDCTLPANLVGTNDDDPNGVFVSCDPEGQAKYLLGPVDIEGSDISTASSSLETTQSGQTLNTWQVNISFTSSGGDKFAEVTKRLAGLDEPRNQFAMVLDGLVISAPSVGPEFATSGITGGGATITGSAQDPFTRDSATNLANQLKFGALPLTFDIDADEQISATLGSEQLEKGLVAGLIGLILVLIYALIQYRILGLLVVMSLGVAGILAYLTVTLLSWPEVLGLRLSLPAIAGLIVAIGITADSFVVYFERIKDELRDGRPLPAAIDAGWSRAKRTILASDAINFAAAIVLYQLAVGGVKGFAFMLGLTTLIDVVLIFWFTHPIMVIIGKMRFFAEGHKWSGLDPRKLGVEMARYVGRGKVVRPAAPKKATAESKTAEDDVAEVPEPSLVGAASGSARQRSGGGRLTIAERRALERQSTSATTDETDAADDEAEGDETKDGEK